MMNSIGFIDILLLIGIAQGVFLAVTLPIAHQNNTKPNKILSVQLALTCILLLSKFILSKPISFLVFKWASVLECIIFLFGPLGYIYIQRLLIKGQQHFRLPFFHYVPALCYGMFLLYLCSYSKTEYVAIYSSGYLPSVFSVVEGLALASNLAYLFLCGHLIFGFEKNRKDQLSFSQPSLRFLKIMFSAIMAILMIWCLSFIGGLFFDFSSTYVNYNMVWISLPVLIYIIGFYALKQPEVFRVKLRESEKNIPKSRLSKEESQTLRAQLEHLVGQEKLYLDSDLTLFRLAERLGTSSNNLSWLLNNVYDTTFYDYINQLRVEAFLEKLKNQEHHKQTLLALSFEVGFKSKSTFNKAFKSKLQETPSNYIKRLGSQSV